VGSPASGGQRWRVCAVGVVMPTPAGVKRSLRPAGLLSSVLCPDRALGLPVVGDDDLFLPDDLTGLGRDEELVVGVAHPPPWIDRPRLAVAQAGMDRPLTETGRQAAQQRGVPGRLAVQVEAEAVQEVVLDHRQPALPQALPTMIEPGPHRQAVLVRQGQGEVEDVVPPTVGQTMPVQVSRREPNLGDDVDLGTASTPAPAICAKSSYAGIPGWSRSRSSRPGMGHPPTPGPTRT